MYQRSLVVEKTAEKEKNTRKGILETENDDDKTTNQRFINRNSSPKKHRRIINDTPLSKRELHELKLYNAEAELEMTTRDEEENNFAINEARRRIQILVADLQHKDSEIRFLKRKISSLQRKAEVNSLKNLVAHEQEVVSDVFSEGGWMKRDQNSSSSTMSRNETTSSSSTNPTYSSSGSNSATVMTTNFRDDVKSSHTQPINGF